MRTGILMGEAGGIYAGPASNASASGLGITLRTGLPAAYNTAIGIPASAQQYFTKPIPIGIFTTWQRLSGQAYTAAGSLDLTTGVFTRTGVNWNQVGVYSADAMADALIGGTAVFYNYYAGSDGQ